MEILEVANPVVTLVTALVVILVLWMVHALDRRLRVLQDHLDSARREIEQLDEGLRLLSTKGSDVAPEAIDLPAPPPAPEGAEDIELS